MKRPSAYALLLTLFAGAVFSGSVLAASTYKWTDDDGTIHYSQQPPRDREAERLRIKTPHTTGVNPGAGTPVDRSAGAATPNTSAAASKTIEKETKENAALRKKSCEAAKKNLRVYQVYRRVKDPDGKVTVLNEKEREKGINESKEAISQYCD